MRVAGAVMEKWRKRMPLRPRVTSVKSLPATDVPAWLERQLCCWRALLRLVGLISNMDKASDDDDDDDDSGDDGIGRVFQLLSVAELLDLHLPCFFLLLLHCAAPSFNIICGRQSCFYDTHCKWQALWQRCALWFSQREWTSKWSALRLLPFCSLSVSIPLPLSFFSTPYSLSLRFPLVNVLRCCCCFCLHPIYVSPIKHMSNVAVVLLLLMLPVVVSLSLLLLLYRPV